MRGRNWFSRGGNSEGLHSEETPSLITLEEADRRVRVAKMAAEIMSGMFPDEVSDEIQAAYEERLENIAKHTEIPPIEGLDIPRS